MRVHPAAEFFPLMAGDEFDKLVADIRENGLREPIWRLRDGRIVDGRNRLRACAAAGIEPRFREWEGDDEAEIARFIVSLNLLRRHLTDEERSMAGARFTALFEADARLRKARKAAAFPAGSDSVSANWRSQNRRKASEEAAALVGVSSRSVERASTVLREGVPELVAAVDAGEVSISAAALVATLPADEQRAVVAQGPAAAVQTAKAIREKPKQGTQRDAALQSPASSPGAATYAAHRPAAKHVLGEAVVALLAVSRLKDEEADDFETNALMVPGLRRGHEIIGRILARADGATSVTHSGR